MQLGFHDSGMASQIFRQECWNYTHKAQKYISVGILVDES